MAALGHQLTDALTVVGEVGRELGDFLAALPTDASALETKLARQGELRTLIRKYAADVDGVLSWAAESRQRLAALDVSEEALSGLARRVDDLASAVATCAVELSTKRTKAAKGLAKAVTAELAGLAMADAALTVAVARQPARDDDSAPLQLPSGELTHAGADGVDVVEFGFTAHRGAQDVDSVLPLNKSASGGELSRVMLALEVVLAASAEGTTMVFDEIDAGVGGRAAVQIGRRLARLARTHQVIVVTHLPQVAAYADTHLVVDTGASEGGAASEVRHLSDEDRVAELARMLAGLGESDTGRAHARELLAAAQQDQVAPRDQPLIAQFAVALDQRGDTGIPIESTALFVRTHQPELIILTVQCQQSGGEGGQRLRRHAATAEIGPRRTVAADRTQRDDAAVVIAFGARGVQDLVDRRGGGGVEVRRAEPALHHRTRGTRTHPGGIRPRPAQQVQAGHHHGLAGPGLTGQDGQPAIELGGGRADRAQCVDPDLGQHLLLAPARHRQPEFAHQPIGERRAVEPHPLQRGLAFGHL